MVIYRSIETATSVLMLALTATPCRYETALHMNRPSNHAVDLGMEKKKGDPKDYIAGIAGIEG